MPETETIIRVENLGKRYVLKHEAKKRVDTARDAMMNGLRSLGNRLRHPLRSQSTATQEEFWALKDVNFEVKRGEVVGIIGRNGAGKSTLLKILSRITEPTTGRITIDGRVASLLEVGTGFHPELSGRENIYLNGAILGMARVEITKKFDKIVAFAEVEKFIDTPVKHYSSGMYMRLAFAVAAHLEPNILIIDEVLAVGDLAFQQKCLRHMNLLTNEGMTILLVSHNMAAVQSCCTRCLFLYKGLVKQQGDTLAVIAGCRKMAQEDIRSTATAIGANGISIVGFEMYGEDEKATREVRFGEAIRIRIDLFAERRIESPLINFGIKRGDGVIVCNFNNWYDNFEIDFIEGRCSLLGWLPPLRLIPDFFEIHVLIWPWGGDHIQGDLTNSKPIAAAAFGHFSVVGSSLHSGDGVIQLPAKCWQFVRDSRSIS